LDLKIDFGRERHSQKKEYKKQCKTTQKVMKTKDDKNPPSSYYHIEVLKPFMFVRITDIRIVGPTEKVHDNICVVPQAVLARRSVRKKFTEKRRRQGGALSG
jgi:hypothetical protein